MIECIGKNLTMPDASAKLTSVDVATGTISHLLSAPCCPSNVTDFLLEGKSSDQLALLLLEGERTYGDLQSAANDVTKYLVDAGGRKGDRVILVSENSFFWIASYLGILRAGMVCIPLSVATVSKEIDYVLQMTEARVAFLQAGFAAANAACFSRTLVAVDRELPGSSAFRAVSFASVRSLSAGSSATLPTVNADDLAALMFTSGSTGRPRGVMISHANIMTNTESIIQYLGLTQRDRIMTVLPFHYCFGTSLLHTHLRVGGSLVIDSRFMYPEKVLQRMHETQCTGFAGVPSHYQILLRRSSIRKMKFPNLRYVQQAGGHLAPSFIRELRGALPGTQIFVMYGQTEATARLSYLPPERLDTKLGSIGKAIPGVKLEVLDEEGRRVDPGGVGEIVAEGENIARGYWRDSQSSAKTFRNGKLYTGDIATVDPDGFIYIMGRAKDFLKCGSAGSCCHRRT